MRPLISYDDIATPEPAPSASKQPMNPPTAPPPTKKRKTHQNQQHRPGSSSTGRPHQPVQHWDDPGSQEPQMNYDEAPSTTGGNDRYEEEEEEEQEESRELTHEEIWDDSALIDAWNSAAAEYEAFHGPGKKWKEEPVKKSPLWYNIPPAITPKPKAGPPTTATGGTSTSNVNGTVAAESDSTPLNFDTFVPTHDPSLAAGGSALTAPAMDGASALGAGAENAMVSQDEAFSRAMTAMYWSGYWTAVYHCRRNEAQQGRATVQVSAEEEEDGAEEDEVEDEDMLPAQR